MDEFLTIFLVLLGILGYVSLVTYFKKKGSLEKHGMSSWFGIIMWRTSRGRNFIDLLARPKRFWTGYGFLAKTICVLVMVSVMALLIVEAFLVPNIPADQAPTPDMLIGLPGINSAIPLWYGILGLVVGVVIHEFAHGILTRVGQMRLKSLGVLLFIFPIGAFVEPDEDELVKTEKKRRTAVYAAGPATNIIFALVFAILFSSVMVSSAQVAQEGPMLTTVYDNTPAAMAGLRTGAQIVEVNGVPVASNGYSNFDAPAPGTSVPITYYYQGDRMETSAVSGLVILGVSQDLPAGKAGLKEGMILTSLNGTVVTNEADFRSALAKMVPGATVELSALRYDEASASYVDAGLTTITPANKRDVVSGSSENIAYLGVSSAYLGAVGADPHVALQNMAHPYAKVSSVEGFVTQTLVYIAMPFSGLQPLDDPYRSIYEPAGLFAGWDNDVFWVLANSFYWIFWLNLMLGMTNALPAVPLDGGFLFRDWIDSIVQKVKKGADQKERDRIVSTITYAFIMIVFFLIVWQLIGPRIL